eukprot:scaffold10768_cov24-Cyclotella_meneghiniana.AAC.2
MPQRQTIDKNGGAAALPVLRMLALGPGQVVAAGGRSNSQYGEICPISSAMVGDAMVFVIQLPGECELAHLRSKNLATLGRP